MEEFREAVVTLQSLANEGERLTIRSNDLIKKRAVDALKDLIQDVSSLDDRIFRLELINEFVRPLGALFRFDRQSMEDDPDIMRLNRRMKKVYNDLNLRTARLQVLLESALQLCQDRFNKVPA